MKTKDLPAYYNDDFGMLIVQFELMRHAKQFAQIFNFESVMRCTCDDCDAPLAAKKMTSQEAFVFALVNELDY